MNCLLLFALAVAVGAEEIVVHADGSISVELKFAIESRPKEPYRVVVRAAPEADVSLFDLRNGTNGTVFRDTNFKHTFELGWGAQCKPGHCSFRHVLTVQVLRDSSVCFEEKIFPTPEELVTGVRRDFGSINLDCK